MTAPDSDAVYRARGYLRRRRAVIAALALAAIALVVVIATARMSRPPPLRLDGVVVFEAGVHDASAHDLVVDDLGAHAP